MKRATLLLGGASMLLLTGCLGDVMEIFCEAGPDSDHCYQTAAVQEGDPDGCDKIAGEGFSGSNPPRDKCFLQIAGNTGDPTACDGVEGGFMSYSKEECLEAAFRNHTVDDCAASQNEAACRTAYAKKGNGCGAGFWFDESKSLCVAGTPPGSDDDIESKVEGDLNTIKDAATGKYMDLLTQAIEDEQDDAKKAGLEAYKEFLEKSGETLENAQATVDTLKEIKKIFLDAYDPTMNIDRMPVDKILEAGLFDRIKSRLFGEDAPTERSKADDALSVYEAMLKRQGDIDFLQKSRLERLGDVVSSKAKDEATSRLKDGATKIAEGVAGTAFATVGIVDHALTSFQEAAQKEMFIGLAAAYNRRRDALTQQNPGLDPDEIHKRTVAQIKDDPYQDNPNSGFVKYGNLLENGDCKDANNPLCIDNRVFWTAMDKTYQYANKKK